MLEVPGKEVPGVLKNILHDKTAAECAAARVADKSAITVQLTLLHPLSLPPSLPSLGLPAGRQPGNICPSELTF